MSCREAFFFYHFFCRRSERNPFVLPMQIARRRGDIHSPAGHKARLLFTSNLTQMSIGSVQAALRGCEERYGPSEGSIKGAVRRPAMRGKPDISITTCSPDVS